MPPPLFFAVLGVGAAVGIGAFLIHKHRDDIKAFFEAQKRYHERHFVHEMQENSKSGEHYREPDHDGVGDKADEEKQGEDGEGGWCRNNKDDGESEHQKEAENFGVSSAVSTDNDSTLRQRHHGDNARYYTPMEDHEEYADRHSVAESHSPLLNNHDAWKDSIGVDNETQGDRDAGHEQVHSSIMSGTIRPDENTNSNYNASGEQAEESDGNYGSHGSWVELSDGESESSDGSWSEIQEEKL